MGIPVGRKPLKGKPQNMKSRRSEPKMDKFNWVKDIKNIVYNILV